MKYKMFSNENAAENKPISPFAKNMAGIIILNLIRAKCENVPVNVIVEYFITFLIILSLKLNMK